MQLSKATEVIYRDRTYRFSRQFLGGLREAPRIKPADELLLDWVHDSAAPEPLPPVAVYHDRGGIVGTCLAAGSVHLVSDKVGHHEQFRRHYRANWPEGEVASVTTSSVFLGLPDSVEQVLMHVPKSLDLFELYLEGIAHRAPAGRRVAAAFMTRHFTPRLLEIAARYAGSVGQSRAYKKARLLLLDDLRDQGPPGQRFHRLDFRDKEYRQYFGVFSSDHIDIATQFLLDRWTAVPALTDLPAPGRILDIGCGNGVIGDQLLMRYPEATLAATDISEVAVRSARENLAWAGPRASVHQLSALDGLPGPELFDLIVTNPPFHDGHHNEINTSLGLFRQARKKLHPDGHLVIVANQHLNYATHLRREFGEVLEVARNRKFVIYRCAP
ncbi:methyltransferase [Lewinella sp. W8]|uniref:class I SAM-dependent methyltransferase n=1 Tax=Lewinella sp. W8 TaxID=2528208 RepID=UPI0010678EF2|nr:methyltransferase [Lewinella sp. W8]MTB51422.1 methyltransferase [Lewinella sp. W8]